MNRSLTAIAFTIAILFLAMLPAPATAQPKPSKGPASTHIFPAGGRRGTTVHVGVGAECIPPNTSFYIRGVGIKAPNVLTDRLPFDGERSPRRKPTEIPITIPRAWKSHIEIAADAPVGPVYWNLRCAQGGTGSRPFVIGNLPEFIERESNSLPARAELVTLPVTINGQICGERDVDYYRFSLDAGDVAVCDVLAGRIGSRLDPIVEILGAGGTRMTVEEVHVGSDPVLAFRAASTGDYLLRVANVTFHGDAAHVYRISLSTQPYVRFAFPAGGQAGSTQDVQFVALSGTDQPRTIRRKVKLPSETTGDYWYRDSGVAGNAVQFDVDETPNVIEREPNDLQTAAMPVTLPLTVNGQLLSKTDEDWFQFEATQDQRLTITCRAFPPGTSTLPTLMLSDASGQQLAHVRSVEADDGDCRIEWKAPADGSYRLRVRDLQFGASGGPEFIYRLSIRPAIPEFTLALNADWLNIIQGQTAALPVSIKRIGGFDGPVDLKFIGLPKGVEIDKAQIPAKAEKFSVKFKASDNAVVDQSTLRVIGEATIDGKKVERIARAPHYGTDSEGVSVRSATVDRLQLIVQHKPLFRLFCAEAYLYAHRGSIFRYPMEVERLNDFDGEIILEIGDRQNRDLDGIEMLRTVIAPGKTATMMPIYLPETMHINIQSQSQLYTQAYATFVDKHNRPQSMLLLSEKRNMLRTLPPVVKLKAVDNEMIVSPGRVVTCRFQLERTTNFPGSMQLELQSPTSAAGFAAEPITIAAGQTAIEIKVRISAQRPPGSTAELKFRATGLMDTTEIITEARIPVRFTAK